MVKGMNAIKSAARLRRSAIAERQRLREEWSSLKGTDDESEPPAKVKKKLTKRTLSKNLHNTQESNKTPSWNTYSRQNKENSQPNSSSDALRGVVALVDVGSESRALPLRAALSALGATVVTAWSPLVTHLVWSQNGCRDTRARARALASRVVSPLWVEACAAAARRVSEKVFPSTARDSDLPSPATLCRLLKTAEKENWVVPVHADSDDDDDDEVRQPRLRISSDLEEDSRESDDGRTTKVSVDIETRVNTAPRRALPVSISPPPANPKSRRKLFTVRPDGEDESDVEDTPALIRKARAHPEKASKRPDVTRPEKERVGRVPERQKKVKKYNLTQEQKNNLENAKRIAKKIVAEASKNTREDGTQQRREVGTQRRREVGTQHRRDDVPRIVLSGMPKSQYRAVFTAIQTLKGLIQKRVDYRTTHVLLGSCKEDQNDDMPTQQENTAQNRPTQPKTRDQNRLTQQETTNKKTSRNEQSKSPVKPFSICNRCNSPESLVMKMFECDNVDVTDHCSNPTTSCDRDVTIICSTVNRNSHNMDVNNDDNVIIDNDVNDIVVCDTSDMCNGIKNDKRLRTLKTLLGAARGCRVLHAQWALDSLREKTWLPHIGYELTYLLKIAQKACVERSAIEKMKSEYGYNVFHGMRVCVTETARQRDAALQLLSRCGAKIVDENEIEIDNQNNVENEDGITQIRGRTQNGFFTQNGGCTQNGGFTQTCANNNDNYSTVVLGTGDEEVSSKWVFDSVAAARPRTVRRYINKNIVNL